MLSRGRAEGMIIDLEAKRLPAMGVEAMNQLIWLVGADHRVRSRISGPALTIAVALAPWPDVCTAWTRRWRWPRADWWPSRYGMFQSEGVQIMDNNRIKGTAKQVEGTVKEQIGKLTGNESLEVEGKVEQAEGAVQKAFGKAKDALRKV